MSLNLILLIVFLNSLALKKQNNFFYFLLYFFFQNENDNFFMSHSVLYHLLYIIQLHTLSHSVLYYLGPLRSLYPGTQFYKFWKCNRNNERIER